MTYQHRRLGRWCMHQSERNTPPDQAQAYTWFKQLIDLYTPADTQSMHLKCPPLPLVLPTQWSQHHQELPVESRWYNEPGTGQISLSHHPVPQYQYVRIRFAAQPPALIKVTLCCDCLGYSPAFSSSSAPKTRSAGGYPSAQAQST